MRIEVILFALVSSIRLTNIIVENAIYSLRFFTYAVSPMRIEVTPFASVSNINLTNTIVEKLLNLITI